MNWKVIVFIGLLGYGAIHHYQNRPVVHGAGEMAPNEPAQTNKHTADSRTNEFTPTPLAKQEIGERV